MHNFSWSNAEKKIARTAFDAAVKAELAALVAEFKAKASAADDPAAIWDIRDWLDLRQRQIDADYDYRYSQLIHVFGHLVRSGRLGMDQLAGLADDKRLAIQASAGF